jgi:hypothetical protein
MKCFVDNNISPAIAAALNVLSEREGVAVVHLRDMFHRKVTDIEWLESLAKSDDEWFVLSGDVRVTSKPHERLAWKNSGLTVFFLKRGYMAIPFWHQAWKLIRWWPTILNAAKTLSHGSSYTVPLVSG